MQQPEISGESDAQTGLRPDGLEPEVRRARLAQAAHFDALVDIRDAQTLRLAALHGELRKQAAATPRLGNLLSLQLEDGFPPRLWLDNISFVIMEPDPRTFRLMRQDQTHHETVFETRDMPEMIARVRDYASNRLIERQRSDASSDDAGSRFSSQIFMAWLAGFVFGVLALLMLGVMTGRISF